MLKTGGRADQKKAPLLSEERQEAGQRESRSRRTAMTCEFTPKRGAILWGEVITDLSAGHEIGDEVFHLGGKVVKAGAQTGFRHQKPASKFVGFLLDGVFPAAVILRPAGKIRE